MALPNISFEKELIPLRFLRASQAGRYARKKMKME
jgi:hypothetical protein